LTVAFSRDESAVDDYLESCRQQTLAEIRGYLPAERRNTAGLYDLMLEYPLRPAKALRPALCMSVSLALGGNLDAALPSAAAFELFHNAFLVHDDVEDDSTLRRHGPTLHVSHGVPIAVNVGDGMLALALEPLLDNIRALGLGPALRIFRTFARMSRESVEGQMMELDWIRRKKWDLPDREYLRMVHKKTGWYSFIAPVTVGAITAGADGATVGALGRFALTLGIAFQIKDDLLSLEGAEHDIGKDALGDLWEGKYTLPLLHTLRAVSDLERREALEILARPRSSARVSSGDEAGQALLAKLTRTRDLQPAELALLEEALTPTRLPVRDAAAVARLKSLVAARGGESLAYARREADRWAGRSVRILRATLKRLPDSVHRRFLGDLVAFVMRRTR
jgi:geranylgeranyl diphosphate synthase type II